MQEPQIRAFTQKNMIIAFTMNPFVVENYDDSCLTTAQ